MTDHTHRWQLTNDGEAVVRVCTECGAVHAADLALRAAAETDELASLRVLRDIVLAWNDVSECTQVWDCECPACLALLQWITDYEENKHLYVAQSKAAKIRKELGWDD